MSGTWSSSSVVFSAVGAAVPTATPNTVYSPMLRETAYQLLMSLPEPLAKVANQASQIRQHNRDLIARMIAGQVAGYGHLPNGLGLELADYKKLLRQLNLSSALPAGPERAWETVPEYDDLINLLLQCRANQDESEVAIAQIIAYGCSGNEHLWQDLGLWSRNDLSRLMNYNFPVLAELNVGDMKWKKFIYKQLCAREGIYVCPAPSCAQCGDHARCFAPEE